MRTFVASTLARSIAELGYVVLDPACWTEQIEKISAATNSTGAALLGVAQRPADIPRTPSVEDAFRFYFESGMHLNGLESGMHLNGLREVRGTPALTSGARVLIDQDLVTADEARSSEYYKTVRSYGLGWFAAVALWSGRDPWLLTLQRSEREGSFEPADKLALEMLGPRLTEAATLSLAFTVLSERPRRA